MTKVSQNRDYSIRAAINSQDELGLLSEHFNEMLVEIERQDGLLRESEAKYRGLIDQASDGIFICDPKGALLDVNPAGRALLGYADEDISGLNIRNFLQVDNQGDDPLQLDDLTTGNGILREYDAIRKDGSQIPVEINAIRMFNNQIQGIVRDITQRKRAEEDLRRSEERYRTLFEFSPDAVLLLGENGFFDCNVQTLKMFGMADKEEMITATPWDISPEFQQNGIESRTAALDRMNEAVKSGGNKFEWTHLRKNGEEFFAEVSLTAYPSDRRPALQAIIRDITDRKRAEEALHAAAVTFSSMSGEKFFFNVSKHLATTLGVDYTFIAKVNEEGSSAEIVGGIGKGKQLECTTFELEGAASGTVYGQEPRIYGSDVQQKFLRDKDLVKFGIKGYLGAPIFDREGKPNGILVVLDTKPIEDKTVALSLIQIFVELIAAELERAKAEEALRESADRLGEAQKLANLGNLEWYPSEDRLIWSEEEHRLLGIETDLEPTMDLFYSRVHPADRSEVVETFEVFFANKKGGDLEFRIIHPEKGERYIFSRTNVRTDEDGNVVKLVGIEQDITIRKLAERDKEKLFDQVLKNQTKLKTLSRQLVNAQEVERKSISQELHDDIGQDLTATSIMLGKISDSSTGRRIESELAKAIIMIDSSLHKIRSLSRELRPTILDDLGLVPALRWLLKLQSSIGGFKVVIDDSGIKERPPSEIETVCYRIVQEALTNIMKYAHASQVDLELGVEENELHIVIQDNGRGFDVDEAIQKAAQGDSLGLLSMSERATLVGGKFEITSSVSSGTIITGYFPLDRTGNNEWVTQQMTSGLF